MKQSTMCEILTPIQTTSLEMMGNHANVIICLSNGSFSIVVNPMVHCVMWGWVIGDYSASCYDHRCYLCKLSREFFFFDLVNWRGIKLSGSLTIQTLIISPPTFIFLC